MSFIFLVACPFFLLATSVGDLMCEEDWWPRGVPRIGAGGGLILFLVLPHFSLRRDGPKESDLDEAVTLALSVSDEDLEHIGSTALPGQLAKPVVERGGEHWKNNLRLRDYLRSDASARDRYAEARRAALANGERLIAYSARKQSALAELLAPSRAGTA